MRKKNKNNPISINIIAKAVHQATFIGLNNSYCKYKLIHNNNNNTINNNVKIFNYVREVFTQLYRTIIIYTVTYFNNM